jgi:hypothetical protein
MSNIQIVRLVSGEEIIANVTSVNDGDSVNLKDPAVLLPTPEGKLMFAKWLPYAEFKDTGITILNKHVVFTVPPQKELEDHYTTVIVGGLFVPPAKSVVNPADLKLTV